MVTFQRFYKQGLLTLVLAGFWKFYEMEEGAVTKKVFKGLLKIGLLMY